MKEWGRLKKTVVISAVTFMGLGAIGSLTSPQQNNLTTPPASTNTATTITPPKVQSETTQTQTPVQTAPVQSSPASNDTNDSTSSPADNCPNGTYVNSDGITVCNPYSAPTAPAGATAQCVDGTYSFSLHRSGTCSHHGGVAQWL